MEWVPPVAELMMHGLIITLSLSAVGLATSLLVGLFIGVLSTVAPLWLRSLLVVYVEVWRSLPTLVTLFFVFFALPITGLRLDAFSSSVIGLTLWGSANIAEIVRGAVQSIPATQTRAARALGFTLPSLLVWVVAPQALRRMLPPLVTFLAHLIQNSTLASLVGLMEVVAAAKFSIGRLVIETGHSHSFEIYIAIGACFFAICFPLSRLAVHLERRLGQA